MSKILSFWDEKVHINVKWKAKWNGETAKKLPKWGKIL